MKRLKQFTHFVLIQCLMLATVPANGEVFSTTYYHNDALGSPVAASDENGNLLWREEYRPYGERVQNDPAAEDNTRWYTGHPHDQETGLTYAGARYYDPIVGRFMATDPAGFVEESPISFNRYAYGNNNPYRYLDQNGEFAILVFAAVAVGTFFTLNNAVEEYNANDSVMDSGISPEGAKAAAKSLAIDGTISAASAGVASLAGPFIWSIGSKVGRSLVGKFTNKGGDLFRVVDDVELADIKNTGTFRTAPGQFEGKQFVDNFDDAQKLQKKFSDFFGGNQTIVRGNAPQSVLDASSRTLFSDIPNGTAITVPRSDLPLIKPQL